MPSVHSPSDQIDRAVVGLDRKAVLRHTAHYAGATYVSQALTAVRSFINARWLGPELYGFWGSISFILSFGYHLHGGVQAILAKEIPTERSQGRLDQAARASQLGLSWFGMMLLLAMIALWVVAWRLPPGTPALVRAGWMMAGVILPLEVIREYERVIARAEQRFGDVSLGLFVEVLVSLTLTAWLVTHYRLAGLLIVATITPVVGMWILHRHAAFRWRFVWSWRELWPMMRAGWPILAMTLVFEAMGWIDRVLVLSFVGVTGFGLYALAAVLAQCCFVFPQVMSSVIEPLVYFDYARHKQPKHMREHVWFPLRTLAYLMPMGLVIADLVLPWAIRHWLPAYIPSIAVMRVLIWGSVFMGLAFSTKALIVALGEQQRVLIFYVIAIVTNLLVGWTLAHYGWGLIGIAFGTVIAYVVCCTELLVFALRRLGWSGRQIATRIILLYVPTLVAWVGTVELPQVVARVMGWPAQAIWAVRLVAVAGFVAAVVAQLRRHAHRDGLREQRYAASLVATIASREMLA